MSNIVIESNLFFTDSDRQFSSHHRLFLTDVGNSVYVIGRFERRYRRHCPVFTLPVYSDSGYILMEATSYVVCVLAYFSHKFTSSNLGIWHIYGI